jgi:hypothetical protein
VWFWLFATLCSRRLQAQAPARLHRAMALAGSHASFIARLSDVSPVLVRFGNIFGPHRSYRLGAGDPRAGG